MEDLTKHCPRCQQILSIDSFSKDKMGKLRFCCKSCIKVYKKEQYLKNADKVIAKNKEYADQHKDKIAEYQQIYRDEHRQELNQKAKEYRLINKEIIREKDKDRSKTEHRKNWVNDRYNLRIKTDPEFRERMLQASLAAGKKYYVNHHDEILQRHKDLYWNDPDKARSLVRESVAKWRRNHPEKAKEIVRLRRLLRRGAVLEEGFKEQEHIDLLFKWQQSKCYYCNSILDRSKRENYHIDHIIPACSGGKHNKENLVLSCPFCNQSKGKKFLYKDWTPEPVFDGSIFIWEDEIIEEFGKTVPLKIISTFYISDRNRSDANSIITKLRQQNQDKLLVFDWEWIDKKEAIKNMLASRMGKSERIFARKTEVVSVTTEDAKLFLETYHLQGFGRGSLYLGLVYGDELVAVSAWLFDGSSIQLNRLAFKGTVVGGFGKLVSYFIKEIATDQVPVYSFVDPRYANGSSYEKVGFKYITETDLPVYYYVNGSGMFHRRLFMKDNMKKRLSFFDMNLTEKENASISGFYRVYGVKQKKYLLQNG